MTQLYKAFGRNVKAHRKKLGLTQEALAERSRLETRSIQAIEAGRRNTTIKTLHRLCKALKTSSNKLLPF